MSDKPRVYQGVRVKTTVKELLQRHRAREANSKKVKTISQPCLALQDLCLSSFPSRYVDPPIAIPSSADSSSNTSARSLQQRADSFSFPDSSCNTHMQECAFNDTQEQLGDMQLPGNGYDSVNNNNNINNNNNVGGYNSSFLPLAASLPSPWCRGLSSDADNCYGHGVAPCSTPESLRVAAIDHNSYSPQDSFSSSSSSCYDSPPRMESSYHSFPSEHFHYQHCNLQDCYCRAHCWPGQQESLSAPEFAPYYNPTDYAYTCPVEQSYLKREMQMSSDMCYNVL